MEKDMRVAALQEIYREMDADGRKRMLSAAGRLYSAQNILREKPRASEALTKQEADEITGNFERESRAGGFSGIAAYIVAGILLVFTASVFWIALINPALLEAGITPPVMVRIVITALIGMFCLGSGFVGFMFRRLSAPWRVLIIIAGLGCMDPGVLTDFIGYAIIALTVAVQVKKMKRERTAMAV